MRSGARLIPLLLACAVLWGCEAEKEPEKPEEKAPTEEAAPALALSPVAFADLPGWTDDGLDGAQQALLRSCGRITAQPADKEIGTPALETTPADWQAACDALAAATDAASLKAALESGFTPFAVADPSKGDAGDQGLFTGYFEAELTGSRTQSDTFATPLYARPGDLVTVDLGLFDPDLKGKGVVGKVQDGKLIPYPMRGDIESGALAGQDLELLWIDDPVDVFLLQVQGSGRVVLPDGEVVRVGFAAHNGHGYKSIGRKLIDEGELQAHEASWSGIRKWIEKNPDKAHDLFAFNPRFIFFRLLQGDGPIGAEGVALTPERSMAVDTGFIPLGMPLWLDTTRPGVTEDPLRRLMVAQDKGGAIKGVVRGDFFWGYGDEALAEAGRMKSKGRYFLLLPNPLAERVAASS
ncbi:murein transglycosylase [Rhodospirillaceae bacterium KN72]|uniref:peptidoglycan lytic exotransglycosylase n=1 Tax=Pacificispira spongiicola TaxID=2729598 RepID=A0A7Y0E0M2_9PROT|nr:MltA domain-containing protein [Pacificispira spongiicola]NMM45040.1 murein transglycosylase [Pacificispira spongiicola]